MNAPFILDTNFFIQAHRQYYPLDVVSSFWTKLSELANKGIVASLDKVRDEIFKNDDALKDWCVSALPSDFFIDCSSSIKSYTMLAQWVSATGVRYSQKAKDEFLDAEEADAWLIAHCEFNKVTLVTYEIGGQGAKKVKIPDVCDAFGVRYLAPMDMFRELGEKV